MASTFARNSVIASRMWNQFHNPQKEFSQNAVFQMRERIEAKGKKAGRNHNVCDISYRRDTCGIDPEVLAQTKKETKKETL